MTLQPLSQTRAQPKSQRKSVIALIPARNRHPAVPSLELPETPQEILIDRTIIDETDMLAGILLITTIMTSAKAKSPHSSSSPTPLRGSS